MLLHLPNCTSGFKYTLVLVKRDVVLSKSMIDSTSSFPRSICPNTLAVQYLHWCKAPFFRFEPACIHTMYSHCKDCTLGTSSWSGNSLVINTSGSKSNQQSIIFIVSPRVDFFDPRP